MSSLGEDLRKLRELKLEEGDRKAAYEDIKKQRKEFEFRCMERMEQEHCDSHKTDGTLFVPVETVYHSIQDRSAFVEWAKENDEELVEDRERKELLNQLVRQRLDDGEELPPGVGFYTRPYISQRAAS